MLHRITGVVLFFFLLIHVLDTALVRVSPEAYDTVMSTYKNPLVGVMEIGLVGVFLFHALNGIRVILVDFWRQGPRFQVQMLLGCRRGVGHPHGAVHRSSPGLRPGMTGTGLRLAAGRTAAGTGERRAFGVGSLQETTPD
ncbi:succinate dehydrogenase, cytochrome b556 subunit [Jannaschia sp. R86511]|uniref:succinate dehydrogenase, cytochrome b556 subunit n=1 Tax=Jannaschia sp. R86511 TaxID=3093853 RepID=UPI0036D2E129